MFDFPSASDEPEEQEKINAGYGRTILALSDGLVVTASAKAAAREVMTPYDLLMIFISDLIMAQAHCALAGIFLRGGISIGPFYYENNILLSPALVRAYKMETELATYPVILISQANVERLRVLKGCKHYAIDAEPSQGYFQPFEPPAHPGGEKYYHLDYLAFLADPGNFGFDSEANRKAYINREKYSPAERDEILQKSHLNSAARAMSRHKTKLIESLRAASSDRAKEKYRWLIGYQNRTVDGYPDVFDDARIKAEEAATL